MVDDDRMIFCSDGAPSVARYQGILFSTSGKIDAIRRLRTVVFGNQSSAIRDESHTERTYARGNDEFYPGDESRERHKSERRIDVHHAR